VPLEKAGVKPGAEYRLVPLGTQVLSGVYFIDILARVAMMFGGVQPGDVGRLLAYARERAKAMVIVFPGLSEQRTGNILRSQYSLPNGMRYSTLEQRNEFYQKEFDIAKLDEWFESWSLKGKVKFAVIIGRHTHIFPKEFEEDASTSIIIDKYKNLMDLKTQILEFLPESAYYDRNVYDEKQRVIAQELAFDLDPENLTCPIHGTLADKMKRHQGLAFCELELDMVKDETIKLYEELAKQFSQMRIVYSGRGFHIHVFDSAAYSLSDKDRRTIVTPGTVVFIPPGEVHWHGATENTSFTHIALYRGETKLTKT
jgi:hypothetical protein